MEEGHLSYFGSGSQLNMWPSPRSSTLPRCRKSGASISASRQLIIARNIIIYFSFYKTIILSTGAYRLSL